MGVPPNVHLLQAALAAQNPGAAMAPVPEPPPAVRAMDVVWSVNNPDDRGECSSCITNSMGESSETTSRIGLCPPLPTCSHFCHDSSCHGVAGLVWRVAGETDSEADDSEYEDEEDYIPPGHARVTWCAAPAAALCAGCCCSIVQHPAGPSHTATADAAASVAKGTAGQGSRAGDPASLAQQHSINCAAHHRDHCCACQHTL
jgi:hypothetical protein